MPIIELVIDGQTFVVEVGDVSRSPVKVVVNGVEKMVAFREASAPQGLAPATTAVSSTLAPRGSASADPAPAASQPMTNMPAVEDASEGETIKAPMAGRILSVRVQLGDTIKQGDAVCTLEAMKMEMPINATISGVVRAIHVGVGQSVSLAAPLVVIG